MMGSRGVIAAQTGGACGQTDVLIVGVRADHGYEITARSSFPHSNSVMAEWIMATAIPALFEVTALSGGEGDRPVPIEPQAQSQLQQQQAELQGQALQEQGRP